MAESFERRTYDLLRLIRENEPIGSIRLVELMQHRGYSIKGRTVRLVLSDLDDRGLTEKVPGKGRRLTDRGRSELDRGDVHGRLERIRSRVAVLASQVTYDPETDAGELAVATATVPDTDLREAFELLSRLENSPLSPLLLGAEPTDDGVRLTAPASISLDGVLLSHGVDTELQAAGVAEYHPDPDPDDVPREGDESTEWGGSLLRFTDAVSGERSTVDAVDLLVTAGRTTVTDLVGRTPPALLVVDNREVPLVQFSELRELAVGTRDAFGGVLDIRRPRESGPFPLEPPGWEFASVSYGASGELLLALLAEAGLATDWETLAGLEPRSSLDSFRSVAAEWGIDPESGAP